MNNNIFWLAMCAYAMHIMEEYFYDWKNWAYEVFKLPVNWTDFYITNVVVLFIGIGCASVGWSNPLVALTFISLMLVNAVCFHLIPVIVTKRFSPGVITGCLLFLPVAFAGYSQALHIGVQLSKILLSLLAAVFIMAYPIALLKTKNLSFFNQQRKL